jgi:arginyl-tRNA synthetase
LLECKLGKEGIKKFLLERSLSFSIEELNPKIEYSRNEKFGDYSTAFLLEHKEKIGNPNENSIVLINILN